MAYVQVNHAHLTQNVVQFGDGVEPQVATATRSPFGHPSVVMSRTPHARVNLVQMVPVDQNGVIVVKVQLIAMGSPFGRMFVLITQQRRQWKKQRQWKKK